MKSISEDYLEHWLDHGYAIVEDVMTAAEIRLAQAELRSTFPTLEQYAYAPVLYRTSPRGGHMKDLPFLGDYLNFVALQPEIVSFAEKALETKRIALAQSLIWAKYPGDDYGLDLHMDYRTTMLTYPPKRRPFEDIIFLLYYVDVDEELGPTYVVSKQRTQNELLVPDIRPRKDYPDLYLHERPVHVRAGSMLIYSNATIHRAAALTSTDRIRFSHHIVYQTDDAPWKGFCIWAMQGLTPELQRVVEQGTLRQRELLGFPPLGHRYWDEDTLRGVAARYPKMEMTPYVQSAKLSKQNKNDLLKRLSRPPENEIGLGFDVPNSKEIEQPAQLTLDYCRGVADYYAFVSGIPSDYWLSGLLTYYGLAPQR